MGKRNLLITFGLALGLGAGVAAGLSVNRDVKEVRAYGNGDTTWYVTGEFNNWNKADPKYHLTYSQMVGNNWQFDSDYAIEIRKGEKFNIVYSWDNGAGYNTFCPSLQGNAASDFTNPDDTDYFIANNDWIGKIFLQVYGESASWTGLFSYELTDSSQYDDDYKKCLDTWSYDFVNLTDEICDGTDKDNESALQAIWNDTTITSTTVGWYVAGDFNTWSTSALQMYQSTTAGVYKVSDVYILNSQGFKITNGSDTWYPDSNQYPGSNGYYTITLDTNKDNAVSYTKQSHEYLKSSFGRLYASSKSFFASTNTWAKTTVAYARYSHIINRYASLDNFASATVTRSSSNLIVTPHLESSNNTTTPIIIITSVAVLASVGGFFFIKKRKEDR